MISWQQIINEEKQKEYFKQIEQFLKQRRLETTVFPRNDQLFRAFELTPYNQVKVVILGQDPYHGKNQANGLSFSVEKGEKVPPSLRNIYKELEMDLGISPVKHGDLTQWAKEGVLLLNTILSVEESRPMSHSNIGWQTFTDSMINALNKREDSIIFILWGKAAQKKQKLITNPNHICLCSAHPSPLSAHRGFFGSKIFSRVNQLLVKNGKIPINWNL